MQRDVLLATFLPGSVEHQRLKVVFSPFNTATFRVKGAVPVHLVGYVDPLSADGHGDDEEEEG
jgi:hypothetical protein